MTSDDLKKEIIEETKKLIKQAKKHLENVDISDKSKKLLKSISQSIKNAKIPEQFDIATSYIKKYNKKLWKQIEKLSPKAKNTILIAAIITIPILNNVYRTLTSEEYKAKKELRKINKKLGGKYSITDRATFDELYKEALPLMQLSMFPTECLVLEGYSDNNSSKINTIGLGSFYFPKNGRPESLNWIKTSNYLQQNKNINISGDKALELADCWYRTREGGRILKNMYKKLKGCELNAHEFAAIATIMYNNEKHGNELCNYIKDNYKNPLKCAQKIVSYSAKGFGGIAKRHIHEAFLYLNNDNYVSKIYNMNVEEGINSSGQKYFITSVTRLNKVETADCIEAIKNGDEDKMSFFQNKITNFISRSGRTVSQIINSEIDNSDYKNALNEYMLDEINYENFINGNLPIDGNLLYKKGINYLENKDYDSAIQIFKNITENGFYGSDLSNDMATTYYYLGEYEKCINECRKVIYYGDGKVTHIANYNAGRAYEKLGNREKAIANYQQAVNKKPDNKEYKKALQHLSFNNSHSSKNRE